MTTQRAVLQRLERGDATPQTIARELGVRTETVHVALERLCADRLVQIIGVDLSQRRKGPKPYLYGISSLHGEVPVRDRLRDLERRIARMERGLRAALAAT